MAVMTLSDGRQLGYATMGDPAGFPVVVLHGTPGSWRQLRVLDRPGRDAGAAVIASDRAGYGESSFDPGRTVGSSAQDIGQLIRHLGLAACPVVGLSGGGPTALACGVLLGGDVSGVATVGSPAPLVPRDPALPADRLVTRLARLSPAAAHALFSVIVRSGRSDPEKALSRFAALLAEPDALLLRENAEVRDAFLDDMTHPSATTARAAARDFVLLTRPWDLDLAEMTVPAQVWHGTEDRNVPVAHARVISDRCAAAQLHIVEGGGHMLLSHAGEILASVAPSA
jgi:pimeloyl-ACP methyl ester carboxylesterase